MKQNFILFSILVALLTGTYLFQELGERREKKDQDRATRLLNSEGLGELKSFSLPQTRLLSDPVRGYLVDSPRVVADHRRVQAIFDRLSRLRVRRVIEEDEVQEVGRDHFFPSVTASGERTFRFEFEQGVMNFTIGRKIDVDRAFYVEVDKQGEKLWAVAFDSGPREGAYRQSEQHRDDTSYREILAILSLPASFFFETAPLLSPPDFEGLDYLEIGNDRNRNFTVDLKNQKTSPSAYAELDYDSEAMKKYVEMLFAIKGEELLWDFDRELLDDERGAVALFKGDELAVTYRLFQTYDESEGSFLYTRDHLNDESSRLINLKAEDRALFFRNHQDFWDIYPFSQVPQSLGLRFPNSEDELYQVRLRTSGRFEAEVLHAPGHWQPRHQSFHELAKFITRRADFVSTVSLESPGGDGFQDLEAYRLLFDIESDGRNFKLIQTSRELILVEMFPTAHLRYHYLVGAELPIKFRKSDYGEY